MTTSRKRLTLFIAVPLMLLLLPLSIYFVDTAAASDKVSRNVSIEGEDVSRFTEAEATEVADGYAASLMSNSVTVSVEGTEFVLDLDVVGRRERSWHTSIVRRRRAARLGREVPPPVPSDRSVVAPVRVGSTRRRDEREEPP